MDELDLSAAEAELHGLFPSLHVPGPLRVLGSGFNSTVIEAGGSLVFRIGKNPIAQAGYEKEAACLPALAPYIPFLIPNAKWHVRSSAHFPFGIIGYNKIPGIPLPADLPGPSLTLLADNLATFLFALHQIPLDSLPLQVSNDQSSKWETQYRKVLPTLQAELTSTEFRSINQWWDDFLADRKMQEYNPVIQHGDLWYENMLVDPRVKKLVGIIDWERLSAGDPAQDFATLFHSGEEFARQVIQAYQALGGKLDGIEYRVQRLWAAREFDGLQHAIRFDDRIELDDALWKLRHGPILKRMP